MEFEKTQECVKDSFLGDDWSVAENTLLQHEQKDWKKYGAYFFPQIVINKRTYRGMIDPGKVFDAICSAFNEAPGVCVNNERMKLANITLGSHFFSKDGYNQ